MNDDAIHDLIRQTHAKPELSPAFQQEIWARIAVATQNSWGTKWREFVDDILLF